MLYRYPVTLLFLFIFLITGNTQKERILLDGLFDDWNNREYSYSDPSGDGRFGYDFTNLQIENDEVYIYFSFDVGLEINLQENNDILLLLDTDDNYSTGYPIDNVGADLIYAFGDRGGSFFVGNNQYNVDHADVTLISLPTVSSDRFEISLNRQAKIGGYPVFPDNRIKAMLLHDVQNGDKFPDESGGVEYIFDDQSLKKLPSYSISRHANTEFRLLSYNVLHDNIFTDQANFQRLISAINPDLIAFQEIYDHSAAQTRELIESWLGGNWYSAKQGTDIITVSRFPIMESHYVAGNGAFLLNIDEKPVLLVNAHLPCCDNDSGRQEEVDQIMALIRDAKNGQHSLNLEEKTPIIITGDMNFVGKNRQVKTFVEGDIQNEFIYGDDFAPDWDVTDFQDVLFYASHTPLALTWVSNSSNYNPGRLDYVICSDAVLKKHNAFSLLSSSLPQDSLTAYAILKNDSGIASDHLPVVVDFEIDYTNTVEPLVQIEQPSILTYPSPFQNYFDLELKNVVPNSRLAIHHILGKLMYDKVISNKEYNVRLHTENWPAGMYTISIEKDGQIFLNTKTIKILVH